MKDFNKNETSHFIDDRGTEFIRGPFEVDGKEYDYKLIDKDGEDYCTIEQMEIWDVNIEREIL